MCAISMRTAQLLLALLLLVDALPLRHDDADGGVQKFYNEKIERHVDHIADQIAAFNAERAPSTGERRHDGADEDEQMQSDQPLHYDASAQLSLMRRKLDENAMRNSIRDRVMSFIGTSGGGAHVMAAFGTRDRSFFASCDATPKSNEDDLLLRLHFALAKMEDNIAMANLRLHRRAAADVSNGSSDADAILPCRAAAAILSGESMYRVTVYAQLKAGKKHKSKRKMIDSRVITESTPYVNLNVLAGVREGHKGKVFTAVVEIEDQYGGVVDAGEFFRLPHCGAGSMPTAPPIPTVFEETYRSVLAVLPSARLQPKLDVRTVEVDGGGDGGAATVKCKSAPALRHAGHHAGRQQQELDVNEIRAFLEKGRSLQLAQDGGGATS